jgi:hypothetical protein
MCHPHWLQEGWIVHSLEMQLAYLPSAQMYYLPEQIRDDST